MLFEVIGISIGTVDTNLIKDLKFCKVCAKFVPKIFQMIENNSGLLNNIVGYDESWMFTYNLEGKHQSAQWKHGIP